MAPGGVKLVFDEQFSHRQVEFVAHESRLGAIKHTRKMTWNGMPDKVWIPLACQAGFVIVTGDRNDRTREYTVEDLKRMGARVILVGPFWDHMTGWQKAKWLVLSIERIVEIALGMSDGSVILLKDKHCKIRDL